MKTHVWFKVMTVPLALLTLGSKPQPLDLSKSAFEGCTAPDLEAELLSQLQERWTEWTREKILAFWPHPLVLIAWTEDGTATTFIYRGRVIEDKCECCDLMYFDAGEKGTELHPDDLPLKEVQFYSTFLSQADALETGKLLFSTLNFPNEKDALESVFWQTGQGKWQWSWSGQSGGPKDEQWLVEVTLSQQRVGTWTLQFAYTRQHAYWMHQELP